MPNLSGSLSYRKDSNNFFLNETGENAGWCPLPISVNPKDLNPEDLSALAETLGAGSKYQFYVDTDNPFASDEKNNKGTSKLRPFKTIERALLEVARRSFRTAAQEARIGEDSDIFERYTINLAPGEYEVQNTPGGFATIDNYPDYQVASNLILLNKDWIVQQAYDAMSPSVMTTEEQRATCRRDLSYFVLGLANDISSLTNQRAILNGRALVTSNTSIICSNPSSPPPNYFINAYSTLTKRQQAVIALQEIVTRAVLAAKNLGSITDSNVTIVPTEPEQVAIYNKIDELIDIVIGTLQCTVDPRFVTIEPFGISSAFPETGEPSTAYYTQFNHASTAGVILPRGVSILGEDLRKVKLRPAYVPDYSDPLATRGSVFKMTGANFFSGFSILDKKGWNQSHHMLSAFQFSEEIELEEYYENVRLAFSDKSIYHRAQDAAVLLLKNIEWVSKKAVPSIVAQENLNYATVFESEIFFVIQAIVRDMRNLDSKRVYALGKRFHLTHIIPISDSVERLAAQTFYKSVLDLAKPFLRDAINNEANPAEGGVIDPSIIVDNSGGARCADVVSAIYTYIDIIKSHIDGAYSGAVAGTGFSNSDVDPAPLEYSIVYDEPNEGVINPELTINTVAGASPYIFSATVRSQYGMCGIDGDGNKVKGLKSYLAAQFTVISLQRDTNAFLNDLGEVGGKRYRGSRGSDTSDFRHFGYRVQNGAYSQLVSCFCICPAIHYWADTGGEFSITNSTSNFGDISLYSQGYLEATYPQDADAELVRIVKPKNLEYISTPDADFADTFDLGRVESITFTTPTRMVVTLSGLARNLDRYTLDDPTKLNYVFVSSSTTTKRKAEVVEIDDIDGKTVFTLDKIEGEWDIPVNSVIDAPVVGRQLYFRRFVDTRLNKDREYRITVRRPKPLAGKRKPITHYVVQKALPGGVGVQPFVVDLGETNTAFYLAAVENSVVPFNEVTEEFYDLQLASLNPTLGSYDLQYDLDLALNSVLDLDFDPEDPLLVGVLNKDTYSRQNIEAFLAAVGITGVNLDITTNRFVDVSDEEVNLNFNKPSIIRCGGQTWEYMGYYNYSTGLPFVQTQKLAENLNESQAKLFRIAKTQTIIAGGRVYATGMDEEGNSYAGNTFFDLKTGEQGTLVRGTSTEVLNALEEETIDFPDTAVDFTVFNNFKVGGNVAYPNPTADFTGVEIIGFQPADTTTPGIVKLTANVDNALDDDDRNTTAVTPGALDDWRKRNRLLSATSTSNRVYVSKVRHSHYTNASSGILANDPDHGKAVTYAQFVSNQQTTDPEVAIWQISDPTKANFRCLRDLEAVAQYGNANVTTKDSLVLYMDAGKYQADYTYNFALVINGVNNQGAGTWGNPDGSNTGGLTPGIILYTTTQVTVPSNVLNRTPVNTKPITINSDGDTRISFVHIWTATTAAKDPDISWGTSSVITNNIKKVGETTIEQVLANVDAYLWDTADTANVRQQFGASYHTPFFHTQGVINISGSGSKAFRFCTFSGTGTFVPSSTAEDEASTSGYINVQSSCILSLRGITLRGNEEIRFSDKRGRLLTSGSYGLGASMDGATVFRPSTPIDSSNYSLSRLRVNDYRLIHDSLDEEFVSVGFCGAFISVAPGVTLNLDLTSYSYNSNAFYWGSLERMPFNTELDQNVGTYTLNTDLHNIRLEAGEAQKLYGALDHRITDSSTLYAVSKDASSLTALNKYAFRGTDTLGVKTDNVSVPGSAAAVQTFILDLKAQGPIIAQFIDLADSSSVVYPGVYGLWPDRDVVSRLEASPVHAGQGFIGEFGLRYRVSSGILQRIVTEEFFGSTCPYARSSAWGANLIGSKIRIPDQYHYNLFRPVWKGLIKGKTHYPLYISVASLPTLPATTGDIPAFSASIAASIIAAVNVSPSGTAPAVFGTMGEVPVGTQIILVSGSSQASYIYLGNTNTLGVHLFVPFGSTAGAATYRTATKVSSLSSLFSFSPAPSAGSIFYVVESNMLLRRYTSGGQAELRGWAPVNISSPNNFTYNLLNGGVICNSASPGFYVDKFGAEATSVDNTTLVGIFDTNSTRTQNLTELYTTGLGNKLTTGEFVAADFSSDEWLLFAAGLQSGNLFPETFKGLQVNRGTIWSNTPNSNIIF